MSPSRSLILKPGEQPPETSSELPPIVNPFSQETLKKDISLSVYNGPKDLVDRKPRPATTQDQLLRRIPGWKQPVAKAEPGADGDSVPAPVTTTVTREPILPAFPDMTEMITKDAADQYRQDEMLELMSIKERLAHDGCHSNLKVL